MLKGTVYFFLLGICITHFLPYPIAHFFSFLLGLIVLIVIGFFFKKYNWVIRLLALLLALVLVKITAQRELDERIAFSPSTLKTELEATLQEVQPKVGYQVLYFNHLEFEDAQFANITDLRLTSNRLLDFEAGQRWRFKAVLKSPVGSSSWGAFDYEKWLIANDIDATGYIDNRADMVLLSEDKALSFSRQWQRYWQEKLALDSNEVSAQKAIIYALLTADRRYLTEQQWQQFRDTGTSHLMAISGMHIGFIALIAYLLAKLCGRLFIYFSLPQVGLCFQLLSSFVIAVIYGVLTGWAVPVQRAVLMLSIAYLFSLSGLRMSPLYVLALIAAIVLVISPMAVLDVGFWLSFIAVAAILLILTSSGLRKHRFTFIEKAKASFSLGLRIQWGLSLLLLPVTAFFFGYLPITSFAANLIAIPVISLIIMPSLFLLLVSSYVSDALFNLLLNSIESILKLLEYYLYYISQLDIGFDFSPTALEFFLITALMLIIWILPNIASKSGGAVILLLLMLAPRDSQLADGEFKLVTLDVGRGLSHVVQTKQHLLVYDLGEKWGSSSATERIVYPYLQYRKLSKIDRLVISHNDSDHLGDLDFLLAKVQVGETLPGNALPQYPQFKSCHHAQNWHWDGVEFIWLKTQLPDDTTNDASCVLLIKSTKGSVLLTGDITKKRERLIQQQYKNIAPIDVLITPHHGSKTSSSEAFLNWLKPNYAISSADIYNRYKHPAKKISNRLERLGITHLQTGKLGSIELNIKDEIEVISHRQQQPRWWRFDFEQVLEHQTLNMIHSD